MANKTAGSTLSPRLIADASMGDAGALELLRALDGAQRLALLAQIPDEKVRKRQEQTLRELTAEDFGEVLSAQTDPDGTISVTVRPNWKAERFNRKTGQYLSAPLASYMAQGEASPVFSGPGGKTYRLYAGVIEVGSDGKPNWR